MRLPTRFGRVAATALLAAGLVTVVAVPPAHAVVPLLKVMPLGDSITLGTTEAGGYRKDLWDAIDIRQGYGINFVGSQRSGSLPDNEHEGHSGWTIAKIDGQIASWMSAAVPDVVLLHIGINDLNTGQQDGAPQRLEALVSRIFTARPGVVIILGGLIESSPGNEAKAKAYNAQARLLEAKTTQAGNRLDYVDMALPVTELKDRLHPNEAGYHRMAVTYANALDDVVADKAVRPASSTDDNSPDDSHYRWADVDGDHRDDYLVIADDGEIRAFLNRANGWVDDGRLATGVTADRSQIRFADFDGDGKDDYLVIDDTGAIHAWLNRGGDNHGGWATRGRIATGVTADPGKVRFADLDGDRKADYLIVDDSGAIRAFLNKGGDDHGGWTTRGQIATGVTADRGKVHFADFNGDGKADYLVIEDSGAVRAFLNEGGDDHGGWHQLGLVATGTTRDAHQVRFADLDGDNQDDYLWAAAENRVGGSLNKGGDGHGGWNNQGDIIPGKIAG